MYLIGKCFCGKREERRGFYFEVLLKSQCINRSELRSFIGWEYSEYESDTQREYKTYNDRISGDNSCDRKIIESEYDSVTKSYSYESAYDTETGCLGEKLEEYIKFICSDSFSNTDFFCTLGN